MEDISQRIEAAARDLRPGAYAESAGANLSLAGCVTRSRAHGRGLAFVTVADCSKQGAQPVDEDSRLHNNRNSGLQVLLEHEHIAGSRSAAWFATVVALLAPGAEAQFTGVPCRTRTGAPALSCRSLAIHRVKPDTAAVLRVVGACDASVFDEGEAARCLGGHADAGRLVALRRAAEGGDAGARKELRVACAHTARALAGLDARRGRIRKPKIDRAALAAAERICDAMQDTWRRIDPPGDVLRTGASEGGAAIDLVFNTRVAEGLHGDVLTGEEAQRRSEYLTRKKAPQVRTMLALLAQLLPGAADGAAGGAGSPRGVVVDVGCGRGDLVANVARAFPQCRVFGIDANEQSLAHARTFCAEFGVANASFRLGDAATVAWEDILGGADGGGVLVGLHACGGLSDTIVDVACKHRASFCVCTCCFASNPELRADVAYLPAHVRSNVPLGEGDAGAAGDRDAEQPCLDGALWMRVARLAETDGARDAAQTASTAINATRLLWAARAGAQRCGIVELPAESSSRRHVLVGCAPGRQQAALD